MFKYMYINNKIIKILNLYRNYNNKSDNRHFPPAIREWNNSVYNFNKNNSNHLPVKMNLLNNLLNNYFNLTNNVKIARSKRMRYLRRKSKTRKVFLDKPEIKQSNDKIRITIYSFDRDRQVLIRKLFFYNRPKIYNKLSKFKSRYRIMKINRMASYKFPYSYSVRFIKELKLFRNKNFYKNKHLQQASLFQYIKYILSIFDIQVFIPIFSPLIIMKDEKKWEKHSRRRFKIIIKKLITNIVESKPKVLYWINYDTCSIEKIKRENIRYDILMRKYAEQRKLLKKNRTNYYNGSTPLNFKVEVNNKLMRIINKYILDEFNLTSITLQKLLNNFLLKLRKFTINQIYKKRTRKMLKIMNLFIHNLFRFKTLLPTLKRTIDSLYNKKVELNIVNLKYIYLNSNILTQFIVFRMKRRINTNRLLKKVRSKIPLPGLHYGKFINTNNVMRKGINIFNDINFLTLNKNLSLKNLYKQQSDNVNEYYSQFNNTNKDLLTIMFNKVYPRYIIQNKESKINTVLSTVKYKWLLGIWLEAKGRLTRRNTASRSILNKEFKGNLKDKDERTYFNITKNISPIVLRNDLRSNTQYTSKGSIRRIGSFGVKTWISSK